MRARNLKPGFFKNEDLASIEPLGRILFAGLWGIADRKGKLEDRPLRIKAEVLPYDNCDVEILLGALTLKGFINRYEVNSHKYIEILNFSKHQTPHWQEKDSIIPSQDIPKRKPRVIQDKSKINPSEIHLTPDILTPDILTPDSFISVFETFWKLYPLRNGKKVGKKECEEFFLKNIKKEDFNFLLEATNNYSNSKTAKDNYAKDPIRFLKKDFWKDWIEPPEAEVPSHLRGLKQWANEIMEEEKDGREG